MQNKQQTYWEALVKAFHAHLDVCSRCEPIDLCPVGQTLFRAVEQGDGVLDS